jgi:hypothetical protein
MLLQCRKESIERICSFSFCTQNIGYRLYNVWARYSVVLIYTSQHMVEREWLDSIKRVDSRCSIATDTFLNTAIRSTIGPHSAFVIITSHTVAK